MNTWELIKTKREEANKVASDMGKMATEKRGVFTAEEQEKFDTMSKAIDNAKREIDNLTSAYEAEKAANETRSLIGRENVSETPEAKNDTEKRSAAFTDYVRFGLNGIASESRSLLTVSPEYRSLTAGGVGIVGTREFYNGLFESLKNYAGPIDAGAYVFNRSDGNPFTVMAVDDTGNTATVVAEAGDTYSGVGSPEYADNADPTMTPKTLTPAKYSSQWIQLSLELLQDNAFNAEQYIYSAASKRIGRKLNTDITAKVKAATVGATTAANSAITYADWIGFIHSLNWAYRKNKGKVKIELADSTLAKLRGIVDGNTRPIFLNVTNPQEGVTEVLDGFCYVINDDMDAFGAGKVIAAIADHEQAVGVASVVNPVVVRADQLFMQNGMIGFIVFSRYDSCLLDGSAIRTWKVHA